MASNDPDNPEWGPREIAQARPANEVLPPHIVAQLVAPRGRPPVAAADRRERVTIRLPARVLEYFRATGPGWQSRVADVLEREAGRRVSKT